jgi:ribosomal protein L35
MKTNKSFTKRLRVTRKGKIVGRAPGQNHFNAKDSGRAHAKRQRATSIEMTAAERSRFLPNS